MARGAGEGESDNVEHNKNVVRPVKAGGQASALPPAVDECRI